MPTRLISKLAAAGLVLAVLCGCNKNAEQAPAADRATLSCASNLRMLDATKAQWAQAMGKGSNDVPTMDDLAPYFRHGPPNCPAGGAYTLGAVGEPAKCSIDAHNQYYQGRPPAGQ
jgi:hypothetical protein